MDMKTGEVRELTEDERHLIERRMDRLGSVIDSKVAEQQAMKDVGLMVMTDEQVEDTKWRSPRNAKRYMLNQPCTCQSGKSAKKCCYGREK